MARRRRREYEELEDEVQLDEVLEPYEDEAWEQGAYANQAYTYPEYDPPYEEYADEYSEEHEEADHEGRFRIAMGMFDVVSTLAGILIILLLVAMLFMLIDWLRTDILHSVLMIQSGLK